MTRRWNSKPRKRWNLPCLVVLLAYAAFGTILIWLVWELL
jgi:hypothetical protein